MHTRRRASGFFIVVELTDGREDVSGQVANRVVTERLVHRPERDSETLKQRPGDREIVAVPGSRCAYYGHRGRYFAAVREVGRWSPCCLGRRDSIPPPPVYSPDAPLVPGGGGVETRALTPLTPEQQAREEIDKALVAAGWLIQDRAELNLTAGRGVAVREFPMASGHGFADYMLFVGGKAVGVLEAKPAGYPLTSVELQADCMGSDHCGPREA